MVKRKLHLAEFWWQDLPIYSFTHRKKKVKIRNMYVVDLLAILLKW